MTPPADLHSAHVRAYYRHRLARATAGYREAFADVLTHRRLEADARRRRTSNGPELEIFREGLREIVQLRLLGAYAPILQTLDRIERQVALISHWRAWAPPAEIPPMPDMAPAELPLFLQPSEEPDGRKLKNRMVRSHFQPVDGMHQDLSRVRSVLRRGADGYPLREG